ncbi:MAG: uroporphyrinogen-III synthase [Actinobacteria bacterium]|nr:MAG: uroporphyrinogen-III synthase [Actinomycetota bacterium]
MSRSPLAGRTILVTRPAERSARLVKLLDQRGARAIVAPTIALRPARSAALSAALRDLAGGRYAWLALTSPATIATLADRLTGPRDVRAAVAAVGDGTAEAFRRWARRDADLQPRTFTVAALARAFPRGEGRVLCPRADIAPDGLEEALEAKGWSAERVDAYRTVFLRRLPAEAANALAEGAVDSVTFTSASTVLGFVGALGRVRGLPKVVCIGPVTAAEARAHGLTVHAVADPHTTDGLVRALERVFAPRRPVRR